MSLKLLSCTVASEYTNRPFRALKICNISGEAYPLYGRAKLHAVFLPKTLILDETWGSDLS